MTDALLLIAYLVAGVFLIMAGDRIGSMVAKRLTRRISRILPSPPKWLAVPIALLIPGIILVFVILLASSYAYRSPEALADNLQTVLLAAFLLTGLVGGFFNHLCKNE